ncbi:hypothetical protein Glove_814100g1 [Diversispora epigaea]|uniref:Uncharacterized protein n=1 Tax=Diversispora epigaea TaxID=1348612 RepID=A0A397FWW7_9GLOM|nr:hypothetical protein Glove_814100g1 [Diversispora epigaea]
MSIGHYSSSSKQTLSSISSTEKDPPFFGIDIAISPDGKQIVTFSPDLNVKLMIKPIAISNCVNKNDDAREFRHNGNDETNNQYGDDKGDLESGGAKYLRHQTQVISTKDRKKSTFSEYANLKDELGKQAVSDLPENRDSRSNIN